MSLIFSSIILCAALFAAEETPTVGFIKKLETGQKLRFVAYGTSLTATGQWVKMLESRINETFPNSVNIINSGGSGMCSIWGLENLDKKVLALKPDVVLIEFATNDAATKFNLSTDGARQNLEKMIDIIQKRIPGCEIILMTMNETTGKPAETRAHRSNDYFQVYRDVAKARKLLLIDHYPNWKKLLDADPAKYARYVPDGSHPTPEAQKEIMMPEFEKAFFGALNRK